MSISRSMFLMRVGRLAYRMAGRSRGRLFAQGYPSGTRYAEEGNRQIAALIASGNAAAISRLSFFEANAVLNYLEIKKSRQGWGISKMDSSLRSLRNCWDENLLRHLRQNAGVFPNDHASADRFCELYLSRFSEIDLIGTFGTIPGERYLHKAFCPGAISIEVEALEPYRFQNPWSSMLWGKKVLVVHPFAKSITEQYKKRRLLFQNEMVLPEMDLRTLPAVQSIAGNSCGFDTWFDALQWMENKMEAEDFDICLIGAGAYGLPLAVHAKKMGKKAIHMGGATQVLFGIRGVRWEQYNKDVGKMFNEHWIRPDVSETPPGMIKVEGGCYW